MATKRALVDSSSSKCSSSSKRRVVVKHTLVQLVEEHCGPCTTTIVIAYFNGHNLTSDSRFPGGDPQWLTQWFKNRDHFFCLMKNQGMYMMKSNQVLPGKTRFPGDNSLENPIWQLFQDSMKSKSMAKSVQLIANQLRCKLYHKEHRGIPYFNCQQCPLAVSRHTSTEEHWNEFVKEHLDLILEYLKQLPGSVQHHFAMSMDESWLEGSKNYCQ
jgi:hypothetical protein